VPDLRVIRRRAAGHQLGHPDHPRGHLPLPGFRLLRRERADGPLGLLELLRPPLAGFRLVGRVVEALEEVLGPADRRSWHRTVSFPLRRDGAVLQFGDGAGHGLGERAEAVALGRQPCVMPPQRGHRVRLAADRPLDLAQAEVKSSRSAGIQRPARPWDRPSGRRGGRQGNGRVTMTGVFVGAGEPATDRSEEKKKGLGRAADDLASLGDQGAVELLAFEVRRGPRVARRPLIIGRAEDDQAGKDRNP
jgi:hypothetical protein